MDLVDPNANLGIILPEMIIAVAGIVVMVYDSIFPKQRSVTGAIALFGIAVSAVILAMMWSSGDTGSPQAWYGMIANDNLRMGFSFVFLLVSAMTILISTVWVEREDVPIGEYRYVRNDADGVGKRSGRYIPRP